MSFVQSWIVILYVIAKKKYRNGLNAAPDIRHTIIHLSIIKANI